MKIKSAFVPQRLILDNILVENELLHALKTKRSGNVNHVALKLDVHKAYLR